MLVAVLCLELIQFFFYNLRIITLPEFKGHYATLRMLQKSNLTSKQVIVIEVGTLLMDTAHSCFIKTKHIMSLIILHHAVHETWLQGKGV